MTKIDIVSGFLGAGKTTLIKKLLKEALADAKVVLIENEFGEIGIDGGFLKEAGIGDICSGKDFDRAFRSREAFGCDEGGAGRSVGCRGGTEQCGGSSGCHEMQDVYQEFRGVFY